ncbi:MAG: glycoside hydrolase family 2 TIM barrel-domain containing protein [Candidatus Auribacterota bacterium]|nr:glycoside hydrolase family 2 TIM barrel-domain containing protein [Candidatus Auribacterota bacterium]
MKLFKRILIFFVIFLFFFDCASVASRRERKRAKLAVKRPAMPVITWDNKRIYVNGETYFIRGVNYSGTRENVDKITVDEIKRDIKLFKELNINTLRLWQDPVPVEILDLLYKNGIMVVMQINNKGAYSGSWTDFKSEKQLEFYIKTARQQVRRDKSHPAILMWCLWNDGPFSLETTQKYAQKEMEGWLGEIAKAVKEEDPGRPVTATNMDNSGYSDLGAGFLDILGFNNYAGLHGLSGYTHAVTLRAFDRLAELGAKYKKPVIITETGYHTLTRPELQGKVVKSLVDAARTRTAGIFIFQFADQWSKAGSPDVQDRHVEDHWGIVTRDRKPKKGFFALKDAYAKIKKSGPEEADIEPYTDAKIPFPANVEGAKLAEDFEDDWSDFKSRVQGPYTGGGKFNVMISDEKAWTGKQSLNVGYSAKQVIDWGCVVVELDEPIPPEAKGIGLWVYRDGSYNSFIVQLEDADRDIWEDYSVKLAEPGWVYYVIDFNRIVRSFYGSAENSNGIFDDGTVKKIILLFRTVASPKASSIYIDDIKVLY